MSLLDRVRGAEIQDEIPDVIPAEIEDEFAQDLEPGEKRTRGKKAPARRATSTPASVSPALKKRIKAELEMYAEFLVFPLEMRDPICGQALAESKTAVVDRIANILCRYPDMAAKFVSSGVLADWLGLLIALRPVATAVYQHHIAKTIGQEGEQRGPDLSAFGPYRPA